MAQITVDYEEGIAKPETKVIYGTITNSGAITHTVEHDSDCCIGVGYRYTQGRYNWNYFQLNGEYVNAESTPSGAWSYGASTSVYLFRIGSVKAGDIITIPASDNNYPYILIY